MKLSKRLFSFALSLLLLFALSVPAFAEGAAAYQSTGEFIAAISDSPDYDYTVGSTVTAEDGSVYEVVKLVYHGSLTEQPLDILAMFSADGTGLRLRIADLYQFKKEDTGDGFQLSNALNSAYNWVKFFMDPIDFSLVAESDVFLQRGLIGDLGQAALEHLVGISDEVTRLLAETA